jgi:hypothetical protein
MSNTAKTLFECGVVITEAGSLKDIGWVWTKIRFHTGLGIFYQMKD